MREVSTTHPAGTIGLPVGSLARYWQVYASLDTLHVPPGTEMLFGEGVNIAYNLNKIIREMKGEWLFIMGDDHRFREDLLLRLLDHVVDVVVPMTCRRGVPFQTVLYKYAALDTSSYMTYSWDDLSHDYPNGGLATIEAAGSAAMLIRKHVLTTMSDPWFTWEAEKVSEDVNFCLKARAKGFNIYADLDQTFTHITPCELEPYRDKNGKWQVSASVDRRRVSLTNTPYQGNDMRMVKYGRVNGETMVAT
jgi:hypothetical protein